MTLAFLNYPSSNSFQVRRSHGWPTSPYLLVIQADCREQTLSTKRVAARTSSNQSTRWLKSPQRVTIGLIRDSSSMSCFFSDERASVATPEILHWGLPLLQVLLKSCPILFVTVLATIRQQTISPAFLSVIQFQSLTRKWIAMPSMPKKTFRSPITRLVMKMDSARTSFQQPMILGHMWRTDLRRCGGVGRSGL